MVFNNSSSFINSANDCLHDTVAYDKESVGKGGVEDSISVTLACMPSAALIGDP